LWISFLVLVIGPEGGGPNFWQVALIPPLVVLAVGAALVWALKGFVWKKNTTTPKPQIKPNTPALTINLEWPDGKGFTQCSREYHENSTSLQFSNPAYLPRERPEDYERYAAYLRERDRLIAEGHTGKSFCYDQSQPVSESLGGKIRVTKGFFLIERRVAAIECSGPDEVAIKLAVLDEVVKRLQKMANRS
jgi:hypothetical protein